MIAISTCRDTGLAADSRPLNVYSLCVSVSITIFFCKFTSILIFNLLNFHSAHLELIQPVKSKFSVKFVKLSLYDIKFDMYVFLMSSF